MLLCAALAGDTFPLTAPLRIPGQRRLQGPLRHSSNLVSLRSNPVSLRSSPANLNKPPARLRNKLDPTAT